MNDLVLILLGWSQREQDQSDRVYEWRDFGVISPHFAKFWRA